MPDDSVAVATPKKAPAPQPPPGVIMAVRCHFCSKMVSWIRIHPIPGPGQPKICEYCLEDQQKQLLVFGQISHEFAGCWNCRKKLDQLCIEAKSADIRLKLVIKDGVYQLHCEACADAYEQKRRDMLSETRYGRKRGIY